MASLGIIDYNVADEYHRRYPMAKKAVASKKAAPVAANTKKVKLTATEKRVAKKAAKKAAKTAKKIAKLQKEIDKRQAKIEKLRNS